MLPPDMHTIDALCRRTLAPTRTMGRTQSRAMDMGRETATAGWKPSILGYMARGDRVPLVMTTVSAPAKTGFSARLASWQLSHKEREGARGKNVSSHQLLIATAAMPWNGLF